MVLHKEVTLLTAAGAEPLCVWYLLGNLSASVDAFG